MTRGEPAAMASNKSRYWRAAHGCNSFVGFTEAMWGVAKGNGDKLPTDFDFKPLPLWNAGEITDPVFYADVIGVNAKGENIAHAKKLAALLGSKDVVVASSTGATQPDGVPQYLLLTLNSAYDELATTYPVYEKMKTIANNPGIKMFTLSHELYAWLTDNDQQKEKEIRNSIRAGFSCGCDQATETPLTTTNASTVCTPLCETQGGWNGQWTSASPYVPAEAKGVCGCNACVIP
ncbi:MAG: hypothetical protein F6K09_32190 [Merismopedia sp. SIO2A8]|nr:hypothetical protein [Merismopedia sp. SIO2A8]